jgi:hypothetical protein
MMDGIDILLDEAEKARRLLDTEGRFQGGHNGPYCESETDARNTGHYLFLFSFAYKITGLKYYYDALIRCGEVLISEDLMPYGVNVWHRKSSGSDETNGLIGPAWTIESLIEASRVTNDLKYVECACDIYNSHKFDRKKGVWHRASMDGKRSRIDQTFNHQLWFAACSSKLLMFDGIHNTSVKKDITQFMDSLAVNMTTYPSGLIFHAIPKKLDFRSRIAHYARNFISNTRGFVDSYKLYSNHLGRVYNLYWKSIGYHSFNLQAFCSLHDGELGNHEFWHSDMFNKILEYSVSNKFRSLLLLEQPFGYAYNLSGFELIRFYSYFKLDVDSKKLQEIFELQLSNIQKELVKKESDHKTIKARYHELALIDKNVLHLLKVK